MKEQFNLLPTFDSKIHYSIDFFQKSGYFCMSGKRTDEAYKIEFTKRTGIDRYPRFRITLMISPLSALIDIETFHIDKAQYKQLGPAFQTN